MKILVTGGAGFIGSNFIMYWLKTHPEDTIINLDKLTYAGNIENLKSVSDDPRYTFVKGDICDRATVDKLVKQVELIVHFAAESHVDRSIIDPQAFVKTNVLGTYTLLESAKEHSKVRFHHISTDEVFGALPLDSDEKFDENTPYNPHSPYSASKAGSDHLVRAYFDTYELPVTITNCSNNFGPFHFPEKIIPLAITNVLEGKKIPIYGDGKYVRDWLYVEDHCRAIDLVVSKGKIGETYTIGGMTEDIPNIEVARMICEIMNVDFDSNVEYVKDRPGHDRRYAVNWSKINKELGWKPAYDFKTYLVKTIDWYKENKAWWERIKSGEYKDYYKKQYGGK
ncbi:MAG: dTDP-glucose 4,6-dehydratase [Patescibacteria group bacterium]